MAIEDHVLNFVGDQSGRLALVEGTGNNDDDPDGLAGAIAAAELVHDRATLQLNGRVSAGDIATAKAAAKTALGW